MTRIKICGLRREEDARCAAELGADFLGFVLAESPRRAEPREIGPWVRVLRADFPALRLVGVFVRPGTADLQAAVEALSLDLVQLHGLDAGGRLPSARPVILACGPRDWRAAEAQGAWAVLVDSAGPHGGGTGRPWDWTSLAGERPSRLFVAGGLGADNVAAAIRALRPYAVDASSRLESSPGCKERARIEAFVAAVRAADREPGEEGTAP